MHNARVALPWDIKIFLRWSHRPKFQCLHTVWFPQPWQKLQSVCLSAQGAPPGDSRVRAAFVTHASGQPWNESWPKRWLINKSNFFFSFEKLWNISKFARKVRFDLILLFRIMYLPNSIYINRTSLKITSMWQRTQRTQNICQVMLRTDDYVTVLGGK